MIANDMHMRPTWQSYAAILSRWEPGCNGCRELYWCWQEGEVFAQGDCFYATDVACCTGCRASCGGCCALQIINLIILGACRWSKGHPSPRQPSEQSLISPESTTGIKSCGRAVKLTTPSRASYRKTTGFVVVQYRNIL